MVSKASSRTQAWTVGKYTEVVDGALRLRLDPPVITAVSRRTAGGVTASCTCTSSRCRRNAAPI